MTTDYFVNKCGPPPMIRGGKIDNQAETFPEGSFTQASRQWVGSIQLALTNVNLHNMASELCVRRRRIYYTIMIGRSL